MAFDWTRILGGLAAQKPQGALGGLAGRVLNQARQAPGAPAGRPGVGGVMGRLGDAVRAGGVGGAGYSGYGNARGGTMMPYQEDPRGSPTGYYQPQAPPGMAVSQVMQPYWGPGGYDRDVFMQGPKGRPAWLPDKLPGGIDFDRRDPSGYLLDREGNPIPDTGPGGIGGPRYAGGIMLDPASQQTGIGGFGAQNPGPTGTTGASGVGTVSMRAPDGSIEDVPSAHVQHYLSKGAQLVGGG